MFDAAHDAGPIIDAVGGRHVVAVVCTHGHNDHVTVAPQLGEALDAPVLLHPADDVLWRMTHPDKDFRTVNDGDTLRVAGTRVACDTHPGTFTGIGVLARTRAERGVLRRHPVRGRARRDGPVVLRLPDDPAVDLRASSASCPARPSSTPATATPPPSATRSCTTTNGSPAATNSVDSQASPSALPRKLGDAVGNRPWFTVRRRLNVGR